MSDKETCILGLLSETKIGYYGYEIEKIITERGMRHWTPIGFSSIYYILKRLHDQKMVEVDEEHSDSGQVRKRYRLTSLGENEIKGKVLSLLSHPTTIVDPICLGIAHLSLVPAQEATKALDQYNREIEMQILMVEEKRSSHIREKAPGFVISLFDQSITLMQCRRKIAEDIRNQLTKNLSSGYYE